MAICFIIVLIALVISFKNQAMQGFTISVETEAAETEGALYAFSQLRGVLQGNGSANHFGLSDPPPTTGSFSGTTVSGDAAFSGKLTYNKQNDSGGADGYSTTVPADGLATVNVPTCHSAAFLTASIKGEPLQQKYLCLYSGNYPYGLIAVTGDVQVKSVRSVSDYDGQDSHIIGLMGAVYARGNVAITGQLNGRAYSKGSSITVGQGGILYPKTPQALALPADFTAALSNFKSSSTSGLSTSLSSALDDLHAALHRNFDSEKSAADAAELIGPGVLDTPQDSSGGASTSPQPTTNSPGNTDYDNPGGTLTVGTSLRIPSGQNQQLTFQTVKVSQDLLLEDNAVLSISGDVQVTGTIRLGQHSTLVIGGSTTAQGLALTYSLAGANNVTITSTFYGKGSTSFSGGMTQSSTTWVPSLPTPTSDPYPATLSLSWTTTSTPPVTTPDPAWVNPLATAFDAMLAADTAKLAADNLGQYLGTVVAPSSNSTDVPGALVLSDSSLSMGGGAKASGLFNADTVNLGVSQIVGAVWANSVQCPQADFRYFSYFTHAYPHTAAGNSYISAVEQHPTAYGKLP